MKEKDLSVLRHSAAHLLAHAIKELYPATILTIGPQKKVSFMTFYQKEILKMKMLFA